MTKRIGEGKSVKATGIIKKVFPNKRDPYGFALILTPVELRGEEAAFYYVDMLIPQEDKDNLQMGMQMKFDIIDKPKDNMSSACLYKALTMIPLTPADYQGTVVRVPFRNGSSFRVALDITLQQVQIYPSSYLALKLEKDLAVGNSCVVRLTWDEMIDANKSKRTLNGEIVSISRLRIAVEESMEEQEESDGHASPEEESSPVETPRENHEEKPVSKSSEEIPIIRKVGYESIASCDSDSPSSSSFEDEYLPAENWKQTPYYPAALNSYGQVQPSGRHCYYCQGSRYAQKALQPCNYAPSKQAVPCACMPCASAYQNYPMVVCCPCCAPRMHKAASMPNFEHFGEFH